MSDATEITKAVIAGLNSSNSGILFALIVLVGGYFLFRQTFGAFANNFVSTMNMQMKDTLEESKRIADILEKIHEDLRDMRTLREAELNIKAPTREEKINA